MAFYPGEERTLLVMLGNADSVPHQGSLRFSVSGPGPGELYRVTQPIVVPPAGSTERFTYTPVFPGTYSWSVSEVEGGGSQGWGQHGTLVITGRGERPTGPDQIGGDSGSLTGGWDKAPLGTGIGLVVAAVVAMLVLSKRGN